MNKRFQNAPLIGTHCSLDLERFGPLTRTEHFYALSLLVFFLKTTTDNVKTATA